GSADGTFYALPTDPAPGPVQPLWTFAVKDKNFTSYGKILSSAYVGTIGGTRIVIFGGGSTMYVLDAATGAELASLCFDPRTENRCQGSRQPIEITSSPSVVVDPDLNGAQILTGMDYNENGVGRAGMISLRVSSDPWRLDVEWKFDPERQTTYTTDASKSGVDGFEYTSDPFTHGGRGYGCGNVWTSAAIDVAGGLAFFATANCSTARMPPDSDEFGGESIWALELSDGALAWCYRPRPVNDDDLDFGASPNLLPDGLVGEAGKDGIYYALRRERDAGPADRSCSSHTPVWTSHASTGFAFGGMIGTPAVGASNGRPAIFASSAVPIVDERTFSDPGRMFALHAIDAANGNVMWHAPMPGPSYGSVAYSNGVVFVPDTFTFSIQAYSADHGLPLWSFPLNGAPSSTPAIVGRSMYMGTGTSVDPVPLNEASGVWAFEVSTP
ncbi:MAG TPA: PQQ-binding-like beta-propeller repeat protein, partial [Actinomycetota bacterium]|nr:PQQ-binding-like beta-propeller repeat protein [Actinomycetota bacterium]